MFGTHEKERKQRMKQSTLIENILSKDNLNNAYLQVVRNKGAAGVDGMEYKALLSHLRKNGERIKESIRNQTYKPTGRNTKRRWK